jgi:hypothetical protein
MSLTSKIVLSALLVGITMPAFAQSGSVNSAVSVHKPALTTQAPRVHKVTSATDASKPAGSVSTGTTVNTGIAGSSKLAAKPDAMKTEAPKASMTTGAAASTKPATPAVSGTTTVSPKTN